MNIRELITAADQSVEEHKKNRRAIKYNKKPQALIDPKKHFKPVRNPASNDVEKELTEQDQPDLMQAFRDFLPLAMRELGLSKLPPIKLQKRVKDTDQPTFGRFVNSEHTIYLAIEDRNVIDTLRTLAHELVHFKQQTQDKLGPKSGETGSPIEDEAHVKAGVIMRHFDKKFPDYFNGEALDIDEKVNVPFAGATVGQKAGIPGQLRGTDKAGYPRNKLVGGGL